MEASAIANAPKREIYTPNEIAVTYGLKPGLILREIREGRLKARVKRGQSRGYWVKREWLEEWLSGGGLEE